MRVAAPRRFRLLSSTLVAASTSLELPGSARHCTDDTSNEIRPHRPGESAPPIRPDLGATTPWPSVREPRSREFSRRVSLAPRSAYHPSRLRLALEPAALHASHVLD